MSEVREKGRGICVIPLIPTNTWNASMAGATVQIMVVRQLPPRLSSRMRVSLLSRYGMCERSPRAVSAPMTLPERRRRGGGTECLDAPRVQ